MSELRAFVARKIDDGTCDPVPCVEVYIKSEADKVIAHQKFKRCMEMAKLCNEKWLVHNFAEIPTKLGFYDRWHKRWLELAEKFKPNNSTAQQGKGNKMEMIETRLSAEGRG